MKTQIKDMNSRYTGTSLQQPYLSIELSVYWHITSTVVPVDRIAGTLAHHFNSRTCRSNCRYTGTSLQQPYL